MTKEEKIKEAYGIHWETIKQFVNMEDGSCCGVEYDAMREIKNHPPLNELGIYQHDNYAKAWYDSAQNKHFWRPISLEGIENNNGWTVLTEESFENLENGDYMWYNNQNGDWEVGDLSESHLQNYTHFQAITYPPKPPIY